MTENHEEGSAKLDDAPNAATHSENTHSRLDSIGIIAPHVCSVFLWLVCVKVFMCKVF